VDSTIGPYRVLGALGSGAAGQVFRVQDAVGRELALKLLGATQSTQRFEREGEVTATLKHPGIVRVHGQGFHGDRPYLVYELVAGRDLEACFGELSREQLLRITHEVAEALGHAHAQGVVHRDVKPANVLIDASGRARLADFGMAQAAGLERLTRSGALVGTPHYMAPEQAGAVRAAYGPPTDVWALGVLLYRVLTGATPFVGDSMVQLMARIASQPVRDPRKHDPSLPPGLVEVCLRALQKPPADRYPDGDAFAADLGRALRGESVVGRAGIPRRSPALLVGVGLGGLAVCAALAWAVWPKDATPPAQPPPPPVAEPPPPAPPPLDTADLVAELRAVCETLDRGRIPAARVQFERLSARLANPSLLRAQTLELLADLDDPQALEARWPLLEWLAACAPPRPTEVGSAAQRVAHLGVQLVQQDLEAEREGLRMTPRDDFSPVRERLETLAACELRLDDRRLGEAVLDPLCYEWVIGLQATEDYWWILLAATRLDFVLDGSHYEPEGNQTPEQRARPWGTQPEDPWQRFLELRIVQHETTPTRVTNQGVLQALADPRAFAGRPWRVGPHQWASAAAQLSHTKLGRGWGDPGEARALLERATQLDPQSPYAHHYLAVLLDGQGEPALARAANDRALACYEALYTDRDALRRSVLARILELRIELCDPQRERELALRAFSRMRPVSPDRSAKLLERCPWLAE